MVSKYSNPEQIQKRISLDEDMNTVGFDNEENDFQGFIKEITAEIATTELATTEEDK